MVVDSGVAESQIVELAMDEIDNAKYRNPFELDKVIRERMPDKNKRYYVFIDEIQFVTEIQNPYVEDPNEKLTFIDVVLGLMKIPNADIYVPESRVARYIKGWLSKLMDDKRLIVGAAGKAEKAVQLILNDTVENN